MFIVALVFVWFGCSQPPDPGPPAKPEHPRPLMERSQWLNLNGIWEFRFDPEDQGVGEEWAIRGTRFDRTIAVPFPWESELSGIAESDPDVGPIGWYRRLFTTPEDWSGRRIWLRFEAVDWSARVWVNGVEVGSHEGGYAPFAFDITDYAAPGEETEVVVRAFDPSDKDLPRGKQVERWYTYSSGIWQTVWLEARPRTHLDDLFLVPRQVDGVWSVDAHLALAGPDVAARVELSSDDPDVQSTVGDATLTEGVGEADLSIRIDRPKLWTPSSPHLYPLTIRVTGANGATDEVRSYFGLRTIERARLGGRNYESILLNGKPVYLRGVLDQSFNPQGLHTAPDDAYLKRDMELAKQAGFNFLRVHIKADEPRRLYWADRLGILLMEDVPSAEEISDRGREQWEAVMRAMILRDRNHPSIIAWCLFNETWGLGVGKDYGDDYRGSSTTQQWVGAMFNEAKRLDSTRLVEDLSPNKRDHVETDLNSWHFYIDDEAKARAHVAEVVEQTYPGSSFNYLPGFKQDRAPLINSEYGAVGARHGDRDISWGFRDLTTLLRRYDKIQGYVYTELYDIEFEHNGFYNYDRSAKAFGYDAFVPEMTVSDLQGSDFVGYLGMPWRTASPGDKVEIRPFVSHFSDRSEPPTLRARLTGVNDLGGSIELFSKPRAVEWSAHGVREQSPLVMRVPEIRNYVGAIGLELISPAGLRIAANYVNVVVRGEGPSPRRESVGPRRTVLRAAPDQPAGLSWDPEADEASGAGASSRPGKFWGSGPGWVEYVFPTPAALAAARPLRVEVLAELASKATTEKLAWPQRRFDLDYPQTDAVKHPARVRISLNEQVLGELDLPDDPADSRGVLSHIARVDHGSYGYLTELALEPNQAFIEALSREPLLRLRIESLEGGLSVYGEQMGRYPIDPTLTVVTRDAVE